MTDVNNEIYNKFDKRREMYYTYEDWKQIILEKGINNQKRYIPFTKIDKKLPPDPEYIYGLKTLNIYFWELFNPGEDYQIIWDEMCYAYSYF